MQGTMTMLKKFIFLALLSIFTLSACGGSDSVSDDCDDQDEECLNYDDDDEDDEDEDEEEGY